jgi:hypothetical protein
MKAILKYGRFTDMIILPEVRPYIYILDPELAPSMVPFPSSTAEEDIHLNKLLFRYRGEIHEDIHLYVFEPSE